MTDATYLTADDGAAIALDTFLAVYCAMRSANDNPARDTELLSALATMIVQIVENEEDRERGAQLLTLTLRAIREACAVRERAN